MLTGSYDRYIASDEWAWRRARYFRKHAKRCAACGSRDKLHLHHLSYQNAGRGQEPDSDLLALCELCHTAVHDLVRREHLSIRAGTEAFLARMRGSGAKAAPRPSKAQPHEVDVEARVRERSRRRIKELPPKIAARALRKQSGYFPFADLADRLK